MSKQPKPDYAAEIAWMTFALRASLTNLTGNATFLKLHFQNNAPVDPSKPYQLPIDADLNPLPNTNITLPYTQVMRMLENIEKYARDIHVWQQELQDKARQWNDDNENEEK